MIKGTKVIAFTPCGRKRYMDLLLAHVNREHEKGVIDEWVLFDNPYASSDRGYADFLAAKFDWVKVLKHPREVRMSATIYDCYQYLTEKDCVYVRLDDDLIYLEESAITTLVEFRLANPEPFLVYPTIIGNTRTSYQLQQHELIPIEFGRVGDILCDPMAWTNQNFIYSLHDKALNSIDAGTLLEDFTLPSAVKLSEMDGNISINSFAILGKDMVECRVSADEETYLSRTRPRELQRPNARCGNAIVIHFAYHPQTAFMDASGMLSDYALRAPYIGFRTPVTLPVLDAPKPPAAVMQPKPTVPRPAHHPRRFVPVLPLQRPSSTGLKA